MKSQELINNIKDIALISPIISILFIFPALILWYQLNFIIDLSYWKVQLGWIFIGIITLKSIGGQK